MLKQLSYHCDVQLTLMHSQSAHEGIVSHKTLVKGRSENPTTAEQDIITSRQVAEWVVNLQPAAEDTVLIYYNGHGVIGAFDTHYLLFDPGVSGDSLDRGTLSQTLRGQSAQLRLLITDTCSNVSEDLSDDIYARYATIRPKKSRPYMQDLFLEHEGFLDITAASPGQFAIGNNDLGGHFTSALLSQGFTAVADTDRDGFLSWREAFDKSVARTKALYQEATFSRSMEAELQKQGQTTQEPLAHSPLPTRIGGGSPLVQAPPPVRAVAVLNFTSVPSGAKVLIDGFTVGRTPLTDYELDTDGRSTKEIEVTVKAEGYADAVEKFRVQRGKSLDWEFELKRDIPKTITGRDGAEMVLIPAGEFQMGSNDGDDDEKPVRTVYVDAFYMDKYEVTNAQYKQFVDANPRWRKDRIDRNFHDGDYLKHWSGNDYPSGKANHPVTWMSWYGAMAYAAWAGKRLPTEAEWEYAARGGLAGQTYPWGNAIDPSKANYGDNVDDTTPVGNYPLNGYELYDMAGNVSEWCLDEYDSGFYARPPRPNPIAGGAITNIIHNFTSVKTRRVLRGGSWTNDPVYLRLAARYGKSPTFTNNDLGFRCARSQ